MKKIKYMLIGIIESIWHDLKSGYNSMIKPKELLNILFYVFIIEVFTRRFFFAKITIFLYVIVYVWKIIKQGEWRRRMRIQLSKE